MPEPEGPRGMLKSMGNLRWGKCLHRRAPGEMDPRKGAGAADPSEAGMSGSSSTWRTKNRLTGRGRIRYHRSCRRMSEQTSLAPPKTSSRLFRRDLKKRLDEEGRIE